ncbi:MAG: hypothetical protein CME36_08840 [unclassified Hahellaceae]|nr:hypothetical protein [Hahellaceae bacterium]|tara:strand:+ start:928 stop:3591 length:2664 start_codon:yes stop_codon:yes gene_type:complete
MKYDRAPADTGEFFKAGTRWNLSIWLLLSLLAVTLIGPKAANAALELPPEADVRILIDISGSMKKNDPEDLRKPALNLITELLPEGSKAGVWTFGQYVNMLVPYGKVDDAWRQDAKEKSKLINSVAMYTNIGAALERSAEDAAASRISPPGDLSNAQIILLTDGVVDIAKDPGVNVAERNRVLTSLVQSFKDAGATIHSVALSGNADSLLLKQLSAQTKGVYSLAETSEELSRVFLQAFDNAVQAEEVPLEGNRFDIDSSVEEFTALVFRAKDSDPIAIIDPAGERSTETAHPASINWISTRNYDLITIKRPVEGSWRLEGQLAPGSRVTVVSNLRMIMKDLPAQFFAGEELQLNIGFFENGEPVTSQDLLKLIDVSVTIAAEGGQSGTKLISDSAAPPADGVFSTPIRNLQKTGRYSVLVQADGKTFKRQTRRVMELSPPVAVEAEATGSGDATSWRVHITPLSPNIDREATSIVAKTKTPDGGTLIASIPYIAEEGRWSLPISPVRGDGIYEVSLQVKGRTQALTEFEFTPQAVQAEFPRQEASPNEFTSLIDSAQIDQINEKLADDERTRVDQGAQAEPASVPVVTPIEPTSPADTINAQTPEPADVEPEDDDELLLWLAIGGGGAVLLLAGLGFWWWKSRKPAADVKSDAVAEAPEEEDVSTEELAAVAAATASLDADDDLDQDLFGEEPVAAPAADPEPRPAAKQPPPAPSEPAAPVAAVEDEEDDLRGLADELRAQADPVARPEPEPEPAPEPEPTAEPVPAAEDDDDLEFAMELDEEAPEPMARTKPAPPPVDEADLPEIDMSDFDDIDDLLDEGRAAGEAGLGDEEAEAGEEAAADVSADDGEFNLEDFDIADTDELPDTEDESRQRPDAGKTEPARKK